MTTDRWRVQPRGVYSTTTVFRGSEAEDDIEMVAKCYGVQGYSDEAVARLVAAAPEMLAALRLAENALDFAQAQVDSEREGVALRSWRRDVQKVINLAEGRGE